jgi:phosphate transport system substrate-binding protein
MRRSIFKFLVVILSIVATSALAAEIRVGGGGAACKGFFSNLGEAFEAETGIKLSIKPTTPANGIVELNDGHIDLAAAATSFPEIIKGAAKNGVVLDPAQFVTRDLGDNKILIFVHKNNKVQKLSKEQLQDIFTGKITNWKKVGGDDREIVVVWGMATPGQNAKFTRDILGGKQVTLKHYEATDYKSIRDFIAKTPGAIGIDPHGFVTAGTRNPEIPLITTPVIAVTKGKPSPEVEKLLEYVKSFN